MPLLDTAGFGNYASSASPIKVPEGRCESSPEQSPAADVQQGLFRGDLTLDWRNKRSV